MKKNTKDVFMVRGINHTEIVKDFLAGKYDDMSLPTTKPIINKNKKHKHVQEIGIGKSKFDPIYEKNNGNDIYRIYTTNIDKCKIYIAEMTKSDNEGITIPLTKPVEFCDHCHKVIEGDVLIVPIYLTKYDEKIYVTGEYVAGHYCCGLAIIRNEKLKYPLSSNYKNSEQILKFMAKTTSNYCLKSPAPYYKLLKDYGGSMTPEEYYQGELNFRKNPNYVFVPIKSQWETKIDN